LGDREGIADMRSALALAVERGEGRDAAVQYNNLAVALWPVEGPAGVLDTLREGIEFSERRGIKEFSMTMTAASLDQLIELGRWDQALEQALALDPGAEAAGDIATLLQVRWARARVLAERGRAEEARALAQWLVPASRKSGGVEDLVAGLGCAALAYGAAADHEAVRGLLAEIDTVPNARESPPWAAYLPGLVRLAIWAGELSLAERLPAGMEPMFAYREHALAACRAALAEAAGRIAEAAEGYGEATARWAGFGVVPERAFALLGQGRCLVTLNRPEAHPTLLSARDVFLDLKADPAVRECDRLLEEAIALSS
jgi:tetratricopeptide (TPR) repeat protein